MQLSEIDAADIFSLTLWRSESEWTAGIQKFAGDPVRYEKGKTASEAIAKAVQPFIPAIAPPPPY